MEIFMEKLDFTKWAWMFIAETLRRRGLAIIQAYAVEQAVHTYTARVSVGRGEYGFEAAGARRICARDFERSVWVAAAWPALAREVASSGAHVYGGDWRSGSGTAGE